MGYKPKRTLYRLVFEDPDFEGLVVETKRMSIDGLLGFVQLFDKVKERREGSTDERELIGLLDEMFTAFARAVHSWNVEDDGDQPVPATVAGLKSLDLDFVMAVIESWMTSMLQAPPPLPGTSSSGATSPEAALDLAASSQSLSSSPAPS